MWWCHVCAKEMEWWITCFLYALSCLHIVTLHLVLWVLSQLSLHPIFGRMLPLMHMYMYMCSVFCCVYINVHKLCVWGAACMYMYMYVSVSNYTVGTVRLCHSSNMCTLLDNGLWMYSFEGNPQGYIDFVVSTPPIVMETTVWIWKLWGDHVACRAGEKSQIFSSTAEGVSCNFDVCSSLCIARISWGYLCTVEIQQYGEPLIRLKHSQQFPTMPRNRKVPAILKC